MSLAVQATRMQAASTSQQIGTAVARRQADSEHAVADLVAASVSAAAAPPAGQGTRVDRQV